MPSERPVLTHDQIEKLAAKVRRQFDIVDMMSSFVVLALLCFLILVVIPYTYAQLGTDIIGTVIACLFGIVIIGLTTKIIGDLIVNYLSSSQNQLMGLATGIARSRGLLGFGALCFLFDHAEGFGLSRHTREIIVEALVRKGSEMDKLACQSVIDESGTQILSLLKKHSNFIFPHLDNDGNLQVGIPRVQENVTVTLALLGLFKTGYCEKAHSLIRRIANAEIVDELPRVAPILVAAKEAMAAQMEMKADYVAASSLVRPVDTVESPLLRPMEVAVPQDQLLRPVEK